MSYKIISEKLRVQSCSVTDLTQEVRRALANNGRSLETLTMFYEPKLDLVILNQDNKDFKKYEMTAMIYLEVDEEKRDFIRTQMSESLTGIFEVFDVLDIVLKKRAQQEQDREAERMVMVLGAIPIERYTDSLDMLRALRRVDKESNDPGDVFYDFNPFMYGYTQGIRAERSKRKGGTES